MKDPFTGSWRLNVAASQLPFPAPRSVDLTITADADRLVIVEHSVNADGSRDVTEIQTTFGGGFHPVHGSPHADQFAVVRVTPSEWRTHARKGERDAFTASLTLSSDGTRFLERATLVMPDGSRADALLVYERA